MEDILREYHAVIIGASYAIGGSLSYVISQARKRESFKSRGYRYGKSVRKFWLRISRKQSAR